MNSVSHGALRSVLLHLIILLCAPPSHAIVLGERPLVVEVEKSGMSDVEFDVLNLAKFTGPEKTGKWIKKLQEDSEGAKIHYSNSIHLRFGRGFTKDDVQWICDMLVACMVYPQSVTILIDEQREVFEHKVNPQNMMKIIEQRRVKKEGKSIPEPSKPNKS